MPSAAATKEERPIDADQIVDLFYFPVIYKLGMWLDDQLPTHSAGRKAQYDSATLLAITASARIASSTRRAVSEAFSPATWERCCQAYSQMMPKGLVLPDEPPSYDQVRVFRDRITSDAGILNGLQRCFRESSLAQAQVQGNFAPHHGGPDWAQPDERHSIHGDGTVVAPFSNVRPVVNPLTGERVMHGSRATDPSRARFQDFHPEVNPDNKPVRGVNFVAVHTWTDAGRVCLGTQAALASEGPCAMDLIDDVLALLGNDGVIDRVVWDRAINGWMIDYLMAKHGVQLLGKSVSESSDNAHDRRVSDQALREMVEDMAAALDSAPTPDERCELRRQAIEQMHAKEALSPLGLSIYKTERDYDLVHGKHLVIETVSHQASHGTCEHQLAVDDGALFVVVQHAPDRVYKTAHAPCVSSQRVSGAQGFGRRSQFEVPCAHGSFLYTHSWFPNPRRQPAPRGRTREAKAAARANLIGQYLRPISRSDEERFALTFGRRNDTESFNNQFKASLPVRGIAASHTLPGQELDFLSGAIVNNSRTFKRYVTGASVAS